MENPIEKIPKEVPVEESNVECSKVRGRGRTGKITKSVQLEEYRSRAKEFLDANNKILPASAAVYHEISEKFEGKMTPKAIQVQVTKCTNDIFGENVVKKSETLDLSEESSKDITVSCKINECYAENFQIVHVTNEKSGRTYKSLQPGWTDALHDIIVQEIQSDCIFEFERGSVTDNEFVANATCAECEATLTATSINNRKEIIFEIIGGTGKHTYEKQRRL